MLGWDVDARLPELRAQAESRMTETVQVGVFGEGFDPETGDTTRELLTERYAGVARVRYPGTAVSTSDRVQVVAVTDIVLSLPHGSPVAFDGDEVLVTASTSDGVLVGKSFRVEGGVQAGQVTAHRYRVTELT